MEITKYGKISNDAKIIIKTDFTVNDKISHVIEEENHSGYVWIGDGKNKFPQVIGYVYDLYIITERNENFILNHYSKEDRKPSINKYHFKGIYKINEMEKSNYHLVFLKRNANFNNDKILKNILKL